MDSQVGGLISMIEARDVRGLTRAISIVENDRAGRDELLEYAFRKEPRDSGLTIGVTGAPGVGKSTLVSRLIDRYRRAGRSVGVIAVDPTSPYSGGAFLGDRVRMHVHNPDPAVFIRSLASRDAVGGLSETTKDILYLLKAYRFGVIIVETVGVGQDEVDVGRYVDVTAFVLIPGYGDGIQMAKAGVMEIADVFVVNKSDMPGADVTRQQLANALAVRSENGHKPIVNTVAESGAGVDRVVEAIERVARVDAAARAARYRRRIAAEIRSAALRRVNRKIDAHLERYLDRIVEGGAMTPADASREILDLPD